MTLPLLKIILAMYAVATALLWIATRILAPKEQRISVLRCFGVAFALTVLTNGARHFLTPMIGEWTLLISVVLYVILVMGLFSLSFWRSVAVAAIYVAGVGATYVTVMKMA